MSNAMASFSTSTPDADEYVSELPVLGREVERAVDPVAVEEPARQ